MSTQSRREFIASGTAGLLTLPALPFLKPSDIRIESLTVAYDEHRYRAPYKFAGPLSLHLEYEIKGATKAAVAENTLAAAQRDLAFVQTRLKETFATN